MNLQDKLSEIQRRVDAQPGQDNFDPAYMYKNPHADVTLLLKLLRRAIAALETNGYYINLEMIEQLANGKEE